MISMVLVTGFLGAGKTTLMKDALEAYSDKKVGVIVNEFGDVNIDARLLKEDGIEMAELSNGSIFCACIKDKFVESLIQMSKTDIEYLFIEASGLADPSNMTQILTGISHKTGNAYDYRGSIAIADAETFAELCEVLPAIAAQLEFCGAAIINKSDLVPEGEIANVREKIKEFNSEVEIYETTYCKVDIKGIIDGLGLNATGREARESSNTIANRADTFVVKSDRVVPYDNLKKFLQDTVGGTYRIKGFVNTDRGPCEISTVTKNIAISPWKEEIAHSEIVLISSIGFKLISRITEALEKNLKGIMNI